MGRLGLRDSSKSFFDPTGAEPRAWLVNVVVLETYLHCNDRYGRHRILYADPRFCDKVEQLLTTGILDDGPQIVT